MNVERVCLSFSLQCSLVQVASLLTSSGSFAGEHQSIASHGWPIRPPSPIASFQLPSVSPRYQAATGRKLLRSSREQDGSPRSPDTVSFPRVRHHDPVRTRESVSGEEWLSRGAAVVRDAEGGLSPRIDRAANKSISAYGRRRTDGSGGWADSAYRTPQSRSCYGVDDSQEEEDRWGDRVRGSPRNMSWYKEEVSSIRDSQSWQKEPPTAPSLDSPSRNQVSSPYTRKRNNGDEESRRDHPFSPPRSRERQAEVLVSPLIPGRKDEEVPDEEELELWGGRRPVRGPVAVVSESSDAGGPSRQQVMLKVQLLTALCPATQNGYVTTSP